MKTKEAKESWIRDQYEEMENYENKHHTFNMYKKVREITGTQTKKQIDVIKDKNGKVIIELKD